MAYTGAVLMGLSKIEIADLGTGGIPGSSFDTLGYTKPDSCEIGADDPEVTEITAEEIDTALQTIKKGGQLTIKWEVMNPTGTALVKVLGGTYDSSSDTYSSGSALAEKEVTVKITFKTGQELIFNRVNISGKFSGKVGKSDSTSLAIDGSVLVPADNTTYPIWKIVNLSGATS